MVEKDILLLENDQYRETAAFQEVLPNFFDFFYLHVITYDTGTTTAGPRPTHARCLLAPHPLFPVVCTRYLYLYQNGVSVRYSQSVPVPDTVAVLVELPEVVYRHRYTGTIYS